MTQDRLADGVDISGDSGECGVGLMRLGGYVTQVRLADGVDISGDSGECGMGLMRLGGMNDTRQVS